MDDIFIQISSLLAVTVLIAFVTRWWRQPLIVAYIFAGMVGGPLLFNFLSGNENLYKIFSQLGVVFLLFIIGLNLNFRHLSSIRRVSLISGVGQVLFTFIVGTALLLSIKMSFVSACFLALAVTFSSTIIIMKLLSDKKDTDTVYGRYTIGLMLVQDIIAMVMIIVLGMVEMEQGKNWEIVGIMALKFLMAGGVLYLASKYWLPKILDKIADSTELLFLFTLAWCMGIASFLNKFGFSMEMGAIAAGIALSSSPYQLEIASRIKPLRDFFLILFFIVLGSEMSIGSSDRILLPVVILTVFILIGNPIILYIIFRKLKFTRRNSFLAGLTAAQVSEFGFVLLFAGRQAGYLQSREITIFTLVAIATIFISAYLITYNEQIYRFLLPFLRWFGPDKYRQMERVRRNYDVWVIGYHRIGIRIAEVITSMKTNFCVVDFDPTALGRLKDKKIPFCYGDIADVEFLENLSLANSKMIIMTIPAVDDQINLIKFVRKMKNKVLIVANAYHKSDAKTLYEQGADFVMMPHLIGSQWIAEILRNKKWNNKTLSQLKSEQDSMIA